MNYILVKTCQHTVSVVLAPEQRVHYGLGLNKVQHCYIQVFLL